MLYIVRDANAGLASTSSGAVIFDPRNRYVQGLLRGAKLLIRGEFLVERAERSRPFLRI
jgi:hypothetical protein